MDPMMILGMVSGLVVLGGLAAFALLKNRTAYLGPVKEELQKEKMWLRRGEYNAAMVKGRQNLELLLRLVAEKNGIQLDNSAKAQADAKEEMGRQNQNGGNGKGGRGGRGQNGGQMHQNRRGKKHEPTVMTYQQFGHWLSVNGYLDRVARWEMNQVRIIGNKAAHENYADKDEAWNQLNYLEDILKTVTEKSQNPKKRQEQSKRNDSTEKHVKVNRKKRGGAGEKLQEKPAKQSKAQNAQNAQEKPAKKDKAQNVQIKQEQKQEIVKVEVANEQNPETATKKKRRRRRRKSGQKPVTEGTVNVTLEVPKLEEVPEVKSVKTDAVSEPMTDSAEVKQKSKRRRRRKKSSQAQKPANEAAAVDTAKAPAEKPVRKAPAPAGNTTSKEQPEKSVISEQKSSDAENKPAVRKRRRRRRKTNRPQNANAATGAKSGTDAKANAGHSSGE